MAIAACFVFQREISRSVFWDFFDSIGQQRKSAVRMQRAAAGPSNRNKPFRVDVRDSLAGTVSPGRLRRSRIQEIVRDLPDQKDERERICGIVKDDHRPQQIDRNL
jgi:hypothetical protein